MRRRITGFILTLLAAAGPGYAAVRLPKIFSDDMVLQRDMKLPVWGWAAPGEKVVVTLAGQSAETVAGKDGKWRVDLKPLAAGGPFKMTVTGENTVVFNNVLVGEVWFCSGQSNMTVTLKESLNAEKEIAHADYPRIRFFHLSYNLAHRQNRPKSDFDGEGYRWVTCTPKTAEVFSAVGYYFGRDLHKELNVPIGLIQSSWGATAIQTWCPREVLKADPRTRAFVDQWDKTWDDYRTGKTQADPNQGDFVWASNQAAGLYNGTVAPIIPYAIKGVIWYQGESNTPEAVFYRKLFPAMIRGWREAWGEGNFPFLFVQLAAYGPPAAAPCESDWAELREAQSMALKVPNTAMAVAIDVGDAANIHPPNKAAVGHRLALAAQAVAYGKKIVYSGPIYESMKKEGNKIRLRFRFAEDGLVTKDPAPVKGFAVAGKDRKFVWADARIEGSGVVVWSDKVAAPVAVRYGWAQNSECNLYNKAGLPASPFRTDSWPGVSK